MLFTGCFSVDSDKVVWTVKLPDPQQVYQCGSNVILLRIPQGSVVVILDSHSGK